MSKLLRRVSLEVAGSLRRAYGQLKIRSEKSAFIGNVCLAYSLERKYAIKLLTGNRRHKDPRGRGRTYSEKAVLLLRRLWYATGCLCTKYLRATIDKALADLSALEHVDCKSAEEVSKMSASTMDRYLKGLPREGPGSIRKNRKSGSNAPAESFICCSGEREIASSLKPGHVQVDTVALCGGDMHGSFFWILTLTDKKTQWTEIWPVWNRSAEEVLKALETLIRRFPFAILSLHYDNGKEFMNAHLVRFAASHPEISFQRSRPLKKNDNAHVEQKNGSVVRGLFGEARVDDIDMRASLERICLRWSAYFNFCRPCIMITKRAKMLSEKGFAKKYDSPRLPAQRVLDEHVVSPAKEKLLERRLASTNGIEDYRFIVGCWQRLKRKLARPQAPDERRTQPASLATANEVPILK